jgi:hypothetical protein
LRVRLEPNDWRRWRNWYVVPFAALAGCLFGFLLGPSVFHLSVSGFATGVAAFIGTWWREERRRSKRA